MSTPALIQSICSPSNQLEAGNTFVISFAEPIPAGNCLVLHAVYPYSAGRTVTITDDQSNPWSSTPAVSDNDTVDVFTLAVFVLPNCAANTRKVQIVFDVALTNVQFVLEAYRNIAATLPVNGTVHANDSSGGTTSIATGSFTPGNNDANGGNLIIQSGTSQQQTVTSITQGASPWTLNAADVIQGMTVQYQVQATSAIINPTYTISPGKTWNTCALALKASASAQGGDFAAGMHIRHVYKASLPATSQVLHWVTTGNLSVLCITHQQLQNNTSAISGSVNGAWTKVGMASAESPQVLYKANSTPSTEETITVTSSSVVNLFTAYDIEGAAIAPFTADANHKQEATGTYNSGAASGTIADASDITPAIAGGIVFNVINIGQGPISDSTQIFDNLPYAGMTDGSTTDSGDGYSHMNNAPASPIVFGWTTLTPIVNQPTTWNSVAVAFDPPIVSSAIGGVRQNRGYAPEGLSQPIIQGWL